MSADENVARALRQVVTTDSAAPAVQSWHADADGALCSVLAATPLRSACRLVSISLESPRPGVVSVPLARLAVKTTSFRFPQFDSWRPAQPAVAAAAMPAKLVALPPDLPPSAKPTRIKPPGDIVKLEDRLYYLLQPGLETLIRDGSLAFPFHPFPYQLEGVAFLYPRFAAILADEMGLGKTMQAITAMRLLLHAGEVRSVLLVCPKPLVTNWQREFAQWAPELPLTVIEGDQPQRRWQWQLADAPIKLANYELIQRDREIVSECGLSFDLMILDEAQRIKNRHSGTSQVVCEVPRRRSWALTGTPIENSPEDLVGIFEFLSPGTLNSGMNARKLGRAASEFVLRRSKDKVLTELPPKMFRDADLELSSEQRATYSMAEDEGVLRLTGMGESVTIQHVFELVLRLKQFCNFDPATGESSKFERLQADLEEVAASGRKAIVFSQWVSTLTTLAGKLSRFKPLEYHGQIPVKKRDDIINEFRDNKSRHLLLISYGAGGVGLNLQFAGYVFLFDRWWNPAIEDQAINRAHRIGAAGPVTVTRFLTLSTIEQRIDEILREKREIFDTVFSDTQSRLNLGLTQQEIFGLFKLRSPKGPIQAAA